MLTESQRLRMMSPPTGPVDLVVDTDAYNEIDDQFAIAYALGAGDRLRVQALYAAPFANERAASPAEGMERSYQEILRLLTLGHHAVKVCRGSCTYLPDEYTYVPSEAATDLASRAMRYTADQPLYVAAIGAITNVASALLMRPEIAGRMVVVWLGGNALDWPDNREFNIRQDVAAARVVLGSGVPLVLLPCMGVVSAFTTTEPELIHWLRGQSALCDDLVNSTIAAAELYARGKVWSRPIWDVTAIGWLLNASGTLMDDRLIPTPIPEYDHHWAQDVRRPLCRYVYHIRRDALFAHLFATLRGNSSPT